MGNDENKWLFLTRTKRAIEKENYNVEQVSAFVEAKKSRKLREAIRLTGLMFSNVGGDRAG